MQISFNPGLVHWTVRIKYDAYRMDSTMPDTQQTFSKG